MNGSNRMGMKQKIIPIKAGFSEGGGFALQGTCGHVMTGRVLLSSSEKPEKLLNIQQFKGCKN